MKNRLAFSVVLIALAFSIPLSKIFSQNIIESSIKRPINQTVENFKELVQAFPDISQTITNIYQMDTYKLNHGKIATQYWSSHSLPLYKGGIANRFNDKEFSQKENWEQRYQFYSTNPTDSFIRRGKVNELSPLEKYEAIIGNQSFSLTNSEWAIGRQYIDRQGSIPEWIGACHGTAPASTSHPRPVKKFTILDHEEKYHVTFYPSDIKALLAYIWTENGGPSAIIGTRCRENKSCRDTNPGAFHLTLINLIGLHHKPIIIDTDPGAQVWNRSVISYKISYFNPRFRNYTRLVSNATIEVANYAQDPYQFYRSSKTKKIVGVRAEIELMTDIIPTTHELNAIEKDKTFKLALHYDLELDEFGEILGGMWHQSNFPDFIWVVSPGNLPLSNFERANFFSPAQFDSKGGLPPQLKEIGRKASKEGQVSYWVLDYLLKKAK